MSEIDDFIEKVVRGGIGDGEIRADIMAVMTSAYAYIDVAYYSMKEAQSFLEMTPLPLVQETLDRLKVLRMALGKCLAAVATIGIERANQEEMEKG